MSVKIKEYDDGSIRIDKKSFYSLMDQMNLWNDTYYENSLRINDELLQNDTFIKIFFEKYKFENDTNSFLDFDFMLSNIKYQKMVEYMFDNLKDNDENFFKNYKKDNRYDLQNLALSNNPKYMKWYLNKIKSITDIKKYLNQSYKDDKDSPLYVSQLNVFSKGRFAPTYYYVLLLKYGADPYLESYNSYSKKVDYINFIDFCYKEYVSNMMYEDVTGKSKFDIILDKSMKYIDIYKVDLLKQIQNYKLTNEKDAKDIGMDYPDNYDYKKVNNIFINILLKHDTKNIYKNRLKK